LTAYLELADYLLIAEQMLGLPAEVIANVAVHLRSRQLCRG
jgi:hypothetical protein